MMHESISQVCKQLFPEHSVGKISHLGSGKMGSVYKIILNNGEILCIKILTKNHHSKLQDSSGWKLAYESLDFDFKSYEDNQYFYFTMPYFKGELFHHASQYNLKTRFEIIQNLIKATINIHNQGLIHRDLKCNNIIIDKESGNKVNIIDFGRSINAFTLHTSSSTNDYIQNLQLPGQGATTSNIRRIFQPYTAPEYFRKHYNNNSTIGFRSDYYSIAQLFRFLIPEFSHLADKIIHTEGLDRNTAFSEFSDQIDDILRQNISNPKFYAFDNYFSKQFTFKKIIFFIRQILNRLFNRTFQSPDSTSKYTIRHNNDKNITIGFFKGNKQNPVDTHLASSLRRSPYAL